MKIETSSEQIKILSLGQVEELQVSAVSWKFLTQKKKHALLGNYKTGYYSSSTLLIRFSRSSGNVGF